MIIENNRPLRKLSKSAPAPLPLIPEHLEDLRRSGLNDETIRDAGFYTEVDPVKAARILRRDYLPERGAAMVIPFREPTGELSGYERIKPSSPRTDDDGKTVKYESPSGIPNPAYFPPTVCQYLNDPSTDLLVTEGEKKALKATQERFPAIGLVGVWGWKTAGETDSLIPDLDCIEWAGRHVQIVFDSDAATNIHVRLAESRLAAVLKARGAIVKVLRLPPGPGGAKCGLDDFLVARGTSALRELLDSVSASIPQPTALGALVREHSELKPVLVERVLRLGETACLNAKAKMRKSWTAYGVAVCVAAGLAWLGKFKCNQGRVLIVDFELHPETLANRLPMVGNAMGVQPAHYQERIDVLPMRGRLRNILELEELFNRIEFGKYALIILDALYRILPAGWSENDNAQMAQVFNCIDQYAAKTGAAILVIHHQSKGSQSDRDVVDVGSGASAFARAVDAHLVLRQHEHDGQVVLEGALRSWEPMEPLVLNWTFPIWQAVEGADPRALKGLRTKAEERQDQRDRDGKNDVVDALLLGAATPKELRGRAGMGEARLERLLDLLEAEGRVKWTSIERRGNETRLYELSS